MADFPDYIVPGELGFKRYLLTSFIDDSVRSFNYIRDDLRDVCKRYIALGFHLDEFKRYKYYETFGFTSFDEFVLKNFGIERSALSRCLNVFYEFSRCQHGVHQMFLDEKYESYNYSQLVEMSSMTKEDRRYVKPSMSVSQIREVKKSLRTNKSQYLNTVQSGAAALTSKEVKVNPASDSQEPEPEKEAAPELNEYPVEMCAAAPDEEAAPAYPDHIPSNPGTYDAALFNSLKGITRINHIVKAVPEHEKVGFAFYRYTGKEISPAEAVDKLRSGTEFDFLGYDFIKNQMVFRECEPDDELK